MIVSFSFIISECLDSGKPLLDNDLKTATVWFLLWLVYMTARMHGHHHGLLLRLNRYIPDCS